ncbi:hypothetical protein ACSBR2_037537 [Camellia fascicularis]
MEGKREQGGWIPILKQRGRSRNQGVRIDGRRSGLFTLFVDNIPEAMNPRGLHELFTKFGVVRDVFIPQKRRRSSNTRFGFVRFDCHVAANVATQKTNGLWVDDRKLTVKIAEYRKDNGENKWLKLAIRRTIERKNVTVNFMMKSWNQGINRRSFVEVLKGANSVNKHNITINVEEIGNGWLYESIILRLKLIFSVFAIKEELKRKEMTGVNGVSTKKNGQQIYTLSKRASFRCGRIMIATRVMEPINTNVNLDCKGRVYLIRVCEEQIVKEVKATCTCNREEGVDEYVSSNINGEVQPMDVPKVEENGDNLVDVVDDDVENNIELVEGDLLTRREEEGKVEAAGSLMEISIVEESEDCIGKSTDVGKNKNTESWESN